MEEIVRFLRSKFDNIDFVISGEAKSAGTILALSGNDILMTKSGSLGPIDAQIKIGRTVISAYDYIEWINLKREEAKKYGKLNPLDATMVAQISPGELSLVYHALKFAEDLVVEWLSKYKFQNWKVTETRKIPVTEEMKKKRASEIAKKLMNHAKWRTHGKVYKLYAKFIENPQIDRDFQKKGAIPFPKDNKLICDCGFEIDLTGIRNDLETKVGKKILI